MNALLAQIQEALVNSVVSCRYHGTNFTMLGTEPWSAEGLPRCDSCKQPWRVKRALNAVDVLARTGES